MLLLAFLLEKAGQRETEVRRQVRTLWELSRLDPGPATHNVLSAATRASFQ